MPSPSSSEYDPLARPKPFSFYPPRPSPWVLGCMKAFLRGELRRKLKVTEVEVSDEDLRLLKSLQGKRRLITPSHSGGFEPHVVMYLSKLLSEHFYYVAAMELFEQAPLHRWLMPRLGVYSIIRGAVDRPSFAMTRKLLAEGKAGLVIFPEGQTIWQNSILVPFQQGVFQLAFKGLEDARREDPDASLLCVPVAIKYAYTRDMHASIDESLSRLEAGLALDRPQPGTPRYERLHRVGEAVLAANERVHQLKPDANASMNDRIDRIKGTVVAKMEQQFDVTPSARQTLLDRIRTLFNTVDRLAVDEACASEYEYHLYAERQQVARALYGDLWRLLQFVTLQDGYVREQMTVERFLDVLCLMEMEVFKKRHVWGPRRARIKVGEPLDLRDCLAEYEQNKRQAIADVTLTMESRVREMLDQLGADCMLVRESG